MFNKIIVTMLFCVLLVVVGGVLSPVSIASAQGEATIASDPTEDDSFWRFGFYFNPDDPRINVPKRNGLGVTLNLGHPMGKGILGIVVVMIAGLSYFKYRGKKDR